jgi:DNA-binding transcriptional MerR regulator
VSAETRLSSTEEAVRALQKGDGLRGPQMCVLAGITYRQLDYWARTGLVRPSITEATGSGSARRYSLEDLRVAIILRRMLDAGISLQRARTALPLVREANAEGLRWLVLGDEPVVCAHEALNEIVTGMRFCTVIDLREEAFTLTA